MSTAAMPLQGEVPVSVQVTGFGSVLAVSVTCFFVIIFYIIFAYPLDILPIRALPMDTAHQLLGGILIQEGKVVHEDFNGPLGVLAYLPYAWAYRFTDNAAEVLNYVRIGQALLILLLLSVAAFRRLTVFGGILIAAMAMMTVLYPVNLGESAGRLSTAMDYNKFGFGLLIVIAVVAYFERAQAELIERVAGAVAAFLALLITFYLKLPYFAVGCGLIVFSIPFVPNWRARLWVVLPLLAAVTVIVLDPSTKNYFANIMQRTREDTFGLDLPRIFRILKKSIELLIICGALFELYLLSQPVRAMWRTFLAGLIILAGGFAALSQNGQWEMVPLAVVGLVLLASVALQRLGGDPVLRVPRWIIVAAPVVFVLYWSSFFVPSVIKLDQMQTHPDLSTSSVPELAGLRYLLGEEEVVWRGLYKGAVSKKGDERDNSLNSFWYRQFGVGLIALQSWPASRELIMKYELADYTILELDTINFSAVWGQWPRGWYLWVMEEFYPRPFDEFGEQVQVLMVPKFPRFIETKELFAEYYGERIQGSFSLVEDTDFWRMCVRTSDLIEGMEPQGSCTW